MSQHYVPGMRPDMAAAYDIQALARSKPHAAQKAYFFKLIFISVLLANCKKNSM